MLWVKIITIIHNLSKTFSINRKQFVKSSENTYLFDTNDYGEVILNKIGKRCLQIDLFRNILEFNHKQAMLFMLKYHFLNDPKVVHRAFEFNILNKYAKDVKKNKELLLKANLDQFMKLTDLDIIIIIISELFYILLRLLPFL